MRLHVPRGRLPITRYTAGTLDPFADLATRLGAAYHDTTGLP